MTSSSERLSETLQGRVCVCVKQGSAFAQQEPAGPPPPAGFKEYKNNESSGGVMMLIETIAADAKAMELEAIRSESDAQVASRMDACLKVGFVDIFDDPFEPPPEFLFVREAFCIHGQIGVQF